MYYYPQCLMEVRGMFRKVFLLIVFFICVDCKAMNDRGIVTFDEQQERNFKKLSDQWELSALENKVNSLKTDSNLSYKDKLNLFNESVDYAIKISKLNTEGTDYDVDASIGLIRRSLILKLFDLFDSFIRKEAKSDSLSSLKDKFDQLRNL